MRPIRFLFTLSLVLTLSCLAGCTSILTNSFITPAIGNFQQQTDLQLVCDGAPSYLLMLDSLLVSSPEDKGLLMAATQAYSAFASIQGECGNKSHGEREKAIAVKAKDYGRRLLSLKLPLDEPAADFEKMLGKTEDSALLFWGAYGWLVWIGTQQGSPAALADIYYVEKIMTRLLHLDPGFQGGSVHLFWGIYHITKPPMLGGSPEKAREHFETAIELADRQFLMSQVSFAEIYARSTLDRQLHDSLLEEVLAFDMETAPNYGLSNRLAAAKAKKLLEENFFDD